MVVARHTSEQDDCNESAAEILADSQVHSLDQSDSRQAQNDDSSTDNNLEFEYEFVSPEEIELEHKVWDFKDPSSIRDDILLKTSLVMISLPLLDTRIKVLLFWHICCK